MLSESHGHLGKTNWQPVQIARCNHEQGWRDEDLVMSVAIVLAECNGYIDSYNDNLSPASECPLGSIAYSADGLTRYEIIARLGTSVTVQTGMKRSEIPGDTEVIVSRDVGMFEVNIPASEIGAQKETALYGPAANAVAAWHLWKSRGWQPWASYTSGVVFDDTYVARALLGVTNLYAGFMETNASRVTARKDHHTLRNPFISIAQLRQLYPDVPLG